jgi:hypothetical protein
LERAIARDEAQPQALAAQLQISYFETSAKEATNVDAAFQSLAQIALQRRLALGRKFDAAPRQNVIVTAAGTKRGEGCKCQQRPLQWQVIEGFVEVEVNNSMSQSEGEVENLEPFR